MIILHFIYDLSELYRFVPPVWGILSLLQSYGGTVFFLISGICVTLGRKFLRRGIVVLGCGLLVSAVSGFAGIPIRFGVLHALGVCMLLWQFFKAASAKLLLFTGLGAVVLGFVFEEFTVSSPLFYPLGLTASGFESADFFPLFPYLGYFLLGARLGQILYPRRRSLLGNHEFSGAVSRFFSFCGRHSLLLYLIHQPLLIFAIESAIFIGGYFHEA